MRTVVNIEISVSDYVKIRTALKRWASWMEDNDSPYCKKERKDTLEALKAMEDSAEIINYKD